MKTKTRVLTDVWYSYVRVSDARGREGRDNFHSPAEQEELNTGFADRAGLTILEHVHAIDVSSKNGNNFDLPDFQRIVADIRAGRAAGVIVTRLDRFGRRLRESLNMLQLIEEAGGQVLSATETTTDDPSGRMARHMLMAVNQYQQDRIEENWRRIHDRNHAAGKAHGRIGAGYEKIDGELKPHPVHGPTMTWAFEQRAKGLGITELFRACKEKGLPIRSPQALHLALQNRLYLGEVHRGDRQPILNAHPALTTRATFEAAQRPRTKTWTRRTTGLLIGLVRCESCEKSMVFNEGSTAGPVYRCIYPECPRKTAMSLARLEEYVEAELMRWHDSVLYEAAEMTPDLVDLEAALSVAEDELREWFQNTTAQRTSAKLWQEEADRRGAVVKVHEEALRDAAAKMGRAGLPGAVSFREVWNEADTEDRRKLLAADINRITIKPVGQAKRVPASERVDVEWRR